MEQKGIMKAMRLEAGMTQKEFAAYFGIPYRTVENWDEGNRKIPEYLLRLMAYRLQMERRIEDHPEWTGLDLASMGTVTE